MPSPHQTAHEQDVVRLHSLWGSTEASSNDRVDAVLHNLDAIISEPRPHCWCQVLGHNCNDVGSLEFLAFQSSLRRLVADT